MCWKPLFTATLGLIVFGACANTEDDSAVNPRVDAGSSDDADDSPDSEANTSEPPTDSSKPTDAGETPSPDAGENTDVDATTNASESTGAEEDADIICDLPESAPPSCEACLSDSCHDEYLACHCNSTCAAALQALRDCFDAKHSLDEPSADLASDWAECEQMAAGDGEVSALYEAVASCALAAYVSPDEGAADDPYNRVDGDGTCTLACFDAFAIEL